MEIDNKMVIDSLWDELDAIEEEERVAEEERFYVLADMQYDSRFEFKGGHLV